MSVTALGLFDHTRPDVRGSFRYHALLNEHILRWREDFMLARIAGIRTIRAGIPWTLIEPDQGLYTWELLDDQFAAAAQMELTIIPALTHFSWPLWLQGAEHAVLSPRLPETFAAYANVFCERYAGQVKEVVPIIEIGTDAWSRAISGHWGPHVENNPELAARIEENLIAAFNAAAAVCKAHGMRVLSHESSNCLSTALALEADDVGIDHYTHAGFPNFSDVLVHWQAAFASEGKHPPFSLLERGAPESYNLAKNAHMHTTQMSVRNRLADLTYYEDELVQAARKGICLKYFGTFVVGNLWTDPAMTLDVPTRECDRNALIDLRRNPKGNLDRHIRHELVQAYKAVIRSCNTSALRVA